MLIGYGLKNYFGFREGAEVSFKVPKKVSDDTISKVICVKGKNASGKTNILKALGFLSDFCTKSFHKYAPDDFIHIEPFFRNKKPTEFYVDFVSQGCTYRYELKLTDDQVIRETLFRKSARKVKIIERENNTFTFLIAEFQDLESIKLRSNVSFISSYKQYEIESMQSLEAVYDFFNVVLHNVGYSGLINNNMDTNRISELFYNDPKMFEFTKKIIIASDTGIKDILIRREEDEETKKVKYFPIFFHEFDGKDQPLMIFAESSGTASLYSQLGKYQIVLSLGGILCLDEFDINLHPHILPKLNGLFESEETNKKGAQFIFTTHNSEIMEHMGKYRTYLIEKENNECFAYRLDEIPNDMIRNDRAILPLYNSGKLGGVPNL